MKFKPFDQFQPCWPRGIPSRLSALCDCQGEDRQPTDLRPPGNIARIATRIVSTSLLTVLCGLSGCASSQVAYRSIVMKPLNLVRSKSAITNSIAKRDLPPQAMNNIPSTKSNPDLTTNIQQTSNQTESSPTIANELNSTPATGVNLENSASGETVGKVEITFADLESMALAYNPTLSQAQAAVSGQLGDLRQAGLYPNPNLGYLNGSATRADVKQSNGVFASQEFVTAQKLQLAQLAASEELKRYQWDYEAQRFRVLNDLKVRYYEMLGAQESLVLHRELVEIAEKNLATAEQLLENFGTKADVLHAKLLRDSARLTLDDAEFRYESAWEQLTTMVGVPTLAPARIVGSVSTDIPILDRETCWQELLARSPQIKATEAELGHGMVTLREARAAAVPNITLQTVAEYDRATQATTVSTLVALPIPVFNRNQGNIEKASADIMADQADICRVQLVLRDQLADSFRRYKTRRRNAERFRDSILKNSEENLKLAQQLFDSKQTPLAPVLFARQTHLENKISYIDSLTELHKVVAEIEGLQLSGGLNPAAIGSAIQNQPGGAGQRQRALLNPVEDKASKVLMPAAQISQ